MVSEQSTELNDEQALTDVDLQYTKEGKHQLNIPGLFCCSLVHCLTESLSHCRTRQGVMEN